MEDDLLFFKRFSKEKQDQVRGLVEYATLMGLTGKDLVSIGGKLDRIKQSQERRRNKDIIDSFECLPIGTDARNRNRDASLDSRFKLKTATGAYNFESGYSTWRVTSMTTKVTKTFHVNTYNYELGQVSWDRRSRYELLLGIADGTHQLNF